MRRIKGKVIGSFLAICLFLLGSVTTVTAAETFEQIGNVKPSKIAYTVNLSKVNSFSIFNKDKVDLSIGKRYYLVYTVEEIQEHEMNISGLFIARDKTQSSPYVTGMLKYGIKNDLLLEPGASYFCRVEVTEEGFDYVIARMGKNDSNWVQLSVTETHNITNCKYFGIYFTGKGTVTAKLSSVLCYDEQGNDLGLEIKTPVGTTSVTKTSTAIDDYSFCEAVYWCEENQTSLILDKDQTMGVQVANSGTDTPWYTYTVRGTTLTMKKGKEEVTYDYYYSFMRDSEGNKYVRLGDTKVTFVTGQKEHEGNKTVTVTAAEGYKVAKPADPVIDGYTFKEWCLSDGTVFDFDKYVMESVTLYARYEDGDGHEYLVVDGDIEEEGSGNILGTVILSTGMVLLTAVLIILMVKVGKKYAASKN